MVAWWPANMGNLAWPGYKGLPPGSRTANWSKWMGQDDGSEALEALDDCHKQLTKRARWALEMRFRDKLPRANIAEALSITEHGAKNLMQRAKKKLRTCIEGKLP